MKIEIQHGRIFYSIPELEIEIELYLEGGDLQPGFFTDEASEEYWDANWERIEEEVTAYLNGNEILTNKFKR